jgi:hypothetical protein
VDHDVEVAVVGHDIRERAVPAVVTADAVAEKEGLYGFGAEGRTGVTGKKQAGQEPAKEKPSSHADLMFAA